jgi:hypothetical protein
MIQTLLRDFAQTLNCNSSTLNSDLSLETFYAGLNGKFEDYIRWKFAHYIYQNKIINDISGQSMSIESFDRTDTVFFDSSFGSMDVHFVEWKSMALPVSGQTNRVYYRNYANNNNQLHSAKSEFKKLGLSNYNGRYWNLFVFVDFNDYLIDLLSQTNNQLPKYFPMGILSKYKISRKMRLDHMSICTNNLTTPYTPITLESPSWCSNGEEIKLIFGFSQIQPQNSNTYKLTSI